MNKCSRFSKTWLLMLLLVAFASGCGGEGSRRTVQNSDTTVTAYSLDGATGIIDDTARTIEVTVPFDTDVSALVATFATAGGSVTVDGLLQTSGTTANDFAAPVAYEVTATDGSTAGYIVTVSVAARTGSDVTSFTVAGVAGTVDESAKTVTVILPNGTDLTSLVATFTTTGASVAVAGAVQTSGTTAKNFSEPLTYTVIAADGSKTTYTVIVTAASSSAKEINAFALVGVVGTINETANTIAVNLPSGTNVTGLVATFASSGASVKVGTALQTSGTTANNFPVPVIYTVTAADGTAATYTVTVTLAASAAREITAFSLGGVVGTIDPAGKKIAVILPYGTNVTALVAAFTVTGSSVKVLTKVQKSGMTANNFTAPVAYLVTAADGTTTTYTVTVTLAANSAKEITAYALGGVVGSINAPARTISVSMPSGTRVTALVATFTTTGASLKVGTVTQISRSTANNFTNSVLYTVTAANGSTAIYTVTVTVPVAKGPAPVLLGAAGNYVILAKTAVSTVPISAVTGDVGVSPAATSYLTGFSLTKVGTTSATSPQVVGHLFGADMTAPTSTNLTTAVESMGAAYTDAAGRPNPDPLNLGDGEIGGQTLLPGLYKWTTGVTVSSDVTISGGANDVWIFQIPGNLRVNPGKRVVLGGSARARNIFWQVAGTVEIGTTAHLEGIVLSKTSIKLGTGSSMNGRALAQTAVILEACTVTRPELTLGASRRDKKRGGGEGDPPLKPMPQHVEALPNMEGGETAQVSMVRFPVSLVPRLIRFSCEYVLPGMVGKLLALVNSTILLFFEPVSLLRGEKLA